MKFERRQRQTGKINNKIRGGKKAEIIIKFIYTHRRTIHNIQNPIDIYALINCLNAAVYRKQNTSYRYLVYTARIYDLHTHTLTQ